MNINAYTGRLTADPELKQTQNGKSVCNFTIAVKRPNTKEIVDFIPLVAWGSVAEFVTKYFRKGDPIAVQGYMTTRIYEHKDGTKRKVFECLCDRCDFVGINQKKAEETEQAEDTTEMFETVEQPAELPF